MDNKSSEESVLDHSPFGLRMLGPDSSAHEDEIELDDTETASQPSIDVSLTSPPASPRVLSKAIDIRSPSPTSSHTIPSEYQASNLSTRPTSVSSKLSYEPTSQDAYDDVGDAEDDHEQFPFIVSEANKLIPVAAPPIPSSAVQNPRDSTAPSLASTVASEPESVDSATSSSSYAKKVRPESMILDPRVPKLVLGLAVVDFNHIVGPTIEMAYPPSMLEDEELCKILPFLALPDGAHLNQEDYSYFHVVPTVPGLFPSQPAPPAAPHTIFGISCNRQIATATLLNKEADVTRSTVQKAVVVLASKPLFGLIRDKLGVVTRAFFNQRDFRDHSILTEFCDGLESSLRAQLTESGVYMGTSLRELVHKFRHKTLILLKLLMIQKKMMFFGHPVERLCTYQYSLISLIPGLLLALEDCGAPPLASRAQDLKRATEFKSSDRRSLLRFMGLPLEIFGTDAFFQPYLPLQQIDMMKTDSFLCGATNSILTHQRDNPVDLLVNIETNTFEFQNPLLERLVSLTPADRKWMDDIVQDVNEGWNADDPQRPATMQFKGSDDYLRIKFEDYICSALSSLKYSDFLKKSAKGNVTIAEATGDPNVSQNFGEAWLVAFRQTPAFTIWDRITDPVLFDIVEPRHPCDIKPSVIGDLGLRLSEGIYDLKLEKNLGPTRDAITSAVTSGSSSFLKAVEGIRSEVSSRLNAPRSNSSPTSPTPSTSSTLSPGTTSAAPRGPYERRGSAQSLAPPQQLGGGLRPLSLGLGLRIVSSPTSNSTDLHPTPTPTSPPPSLADTAQAARATLGAWGAGIGSFISSRASKLATAAASSPPSSGTSTPAGRSISPSPVLVDKTPVDSKTEGQVSTKVISSGYLVSSPVDSLPEFTVRDLDKEREDREKQKAEALARALSEPLGSATVDDKGRAETR